MNISKIIVGLVLSALVGSSFASGPNGYKINKEVDTKATGTKK